MSRKISIFIGGISFLLGAIKLNAAPTLTDLPLELRDMIKVHLPKQDQLAVEALYRTRNRTAYARDQFRRAQLLLNPLTDGRDDLKMTKILGLSKVAAPFFSTPTPNWIAFLDHRQKIAQELANHPHPVCKILGALWEKLDAKQEVVKWLSGAEKNYFQKAPRLKIEVAFALAEQGIPEAQDIVEKALELGGFGFNTFPSLVQRRYFWRAADIAISSPNNWARSRRLEQFFFRVFQKGAYTLEEMPTARRALERFAKAGHEESIQMVLEGFLEGKYGFEKSETDMNLAIRHFAGNFLSESATDMYLKGIREGVYGFEKNPDLYHQELRSLAVGWLRFDKVYYAQKLLKILEEQKLHFRYYKSSPEDKQKYLVYRFQCLLALSDTEYPEAIDLMLRDFGEGLYLDRESAINVILQYGDMGHLTALGLIMDGILCNTPQNPMSGHFKKDHHKVILQYAQRYAVEPVLKAIATGIKEGKFGFETLSPSEQTELLLKYAPHSEDIQWTLIYRIKYQQRDHALDEALFPRQEQFDFLRSFAFGPVTAVRRLEVCRILREQFGAEIAAVPGLEESLRSLFVKLCDLTDDFFSVHFGREPRL
jgi:hypothetical protein